jgi:nitroreductase
VSDAVGSTVATPDLETIDVATIGEDVPLLEGIRTACAIRRLKPDPVPPALIRKVCEAGTFAASGGNRQPWCFIAVTDPEFRPYIQPAIEASKKPDYPEWRRKILAGGVYLAEHLHEAPVHLFVAGWTRRGQPQPQGLFPAIQNVLLACRAVGLGASLTNIHLTFRDEVDRWLGLPENRPSIAMLPIGWPKVPYRRPVRRSIDECLFFERYTGEEARDSTSEA